MIADRNAGWLERTCKVLARSQEALLQAGLEICCKPHLHPHIHSTEFISIAGGGVLGRMEQGKGEGETEKSTVTQCKTAFQQHMAPVAAECNSKDLCSKSRTKITGYESYQERAFMSKQITLLCK